MPVYICTTGFCGVLLNTVIWSDLTDLLRYISLSLNAFFLCKNGGKPSKASSIKKGVELKLNKTLLVGIAATLSFMLYGFVWANAFQKVIGNFLLEAFVFGGSTIAIAGVILAFFQVIALLKSGSTPSFSQRQPLPSAALFSDSRKRSASELSGANSNALAKPSSTRTRFTKIPLT